MKKHSLPAKLTPPQLTVYYPRKRLMKLLDTYSDFPVLWISGPAGSGKTTLINSYINERKFGCFWYKVDKGDCDPSTFISYMNQSSGMTLKNPINFPKQKDSSVFITFTVRWFESFFNNLPHRTVVVFDDYQETSDSTLFHAFMKHGMSQIPRGIQVIIISRKAQPPELIGMEANSRLAMVGWNDLRLQPEETVDIVELLAPDSLSEESVHIFHYLADGWIAGIVLMVKKSRMEGIEPHVFYRQAPQIIFDYFESEVFGALEDAIKDFLIKTAFLPGITIRQAEILTQNQQASKILADLMRNNFFLERRFMHDVVYFFHPLFRQFLISKAETSFPSDVFFELLNTASGLLKREGRVSESLELMSDFHKADLQDKVTGNTFGKIGSQLIEALSAFDSGEEDHGFACLEKALSSAREQGYLQDPFNNHASMSRLCARALGKGIETDYVKDLIQMLGLPPDELAPDAWPFPVRIFTLGRFEIIRGDVPVQFSKKAQKKPLEMLKIILAHGGSRVGETHIVDTLWPDADGDLALQACATTLYRLRKLMGDPKGIQRRNGAITIDTSSCWVDALVFSRILDKTDFLWEKENYDIRKEQVCSLACSAIKLYNGDFLPGEEWNQETVSLRESLHSRFFRALSRAGDYLMQTGQWKKALDIFEHGIAMDDCSELCYRGIISCLDKMGRSDEAMIMFHRCTRIFQTKLGIEPSADIKTLAGLLSSGKNRPG